MGKRMWVPVVSGPDPEHEADLVRAGITTLIANGESKVVEFKSTGRKNLHTCDKDPKIEWSAIKLRRLPAS